MAFECESRFLVAPKLAKLALTGKRKNLLPNNIISLYIPPDEISVRLVANRDERIVSKIFIGGRKINVPADKQKEFYEVISHRLTDENGMLQNKNDINIRIRRSHREGERRCKYKFAIKASPSPKDLDNLFEGVPAAKRMDIQKKAKIKDEWQFEFDGAGIFKKLYKNEHVSHLKKIRYRITEDGAWVLDKVLSNSTGIKFPGLWLAEYESLVNFGVPKIRQSWLGNSPNIMGLSSRCLSVMNKDEFAQNLAMAKELRGKG